MCDNTIGTVQIQIQIFTIGNNLTVLDIPLLLIPILSITTGLLTLLYHFLQEGIINL